MNSKEIYRQYIINQTQIDSDNCFRPFTSDSLEYLDKIPDIDFDDDWNVKIEVFNNGNLIRFTIIHGKFIYLFFDYQHNDKDFNCSVWELNSLNYDGLKFPKKDTKNLLKTIKLELEY